MASNNVRFLNEAPKGAFHRENYKTISGWAETESYEK